MIIVGYICCMHDNYFTDLTVPPRENLQAPWKCRSKSLLVVPSVWKCGLCGNKSISQCLGEIKFQPLLLVYSFVRSVKTLLH